MTPAIDPDGWWRFAKRLPSPNFNERPPEAEISLVVVHNISLPPGEFGGGYVEQFFTNVLEHSAHPYFATLVDLQVSAHCLIDREGRATQFVPFSKRAWHAGRSLFGDEPECNDYGVGVELEGCDDLPYTDAQYQALAALTRDLMASYPAITADRLTGHSDIAPGRKTDPGPAFDWHRYRALLNTHTTAKSE